MAIEIQTTVNPGTEESINFNRDVAKSPLKVWSIESLVRQIAFAVEHSRCNVEDRTATVEIFNRNSDMLLWEIVVENGIIDGELKEITGSDRMPEAKVIRHILSSIVAVQKATQQATKQHIKNIIAAS